MKKLLCFLLCLTLIFSSISLCFAQDWSSTDSQNLQNISNRLYYNNNSAAYYLYQILSHMSTIEGYIDQIEGFLQYGGHNISYWVNAISTWMSPIYTELQDIAGVSDLEGVILANSTQSINNQQGDLTSKMHSQLGNPTDAGYNYGWYQTYSVNANGTTGFTNYQWQRGTPIGNLAVLMKSVNDTIAKTYSYRYSTDIVGYNSIQSAINWGNNSTSTFTPVSAIDGIYKWFSAIQAPVSRLSYVLANDEDIEAREAAAANQQAVVDNFIDSTGDGSASPSDIGSISDLSSGYKQNFGSDASPSGIFDIFNSDHATWFSQETKNQLDTTTPTRLSKGSESETPLLDKQIEDIYNALGVKQP